MDQHPRDYYNRRKVELELERESFMNHWKELAEFVRPRRGRFFVSDRNKGDKRYNSIINSKATQAHKICTSGMLAGTMSPTRPWFALETHDPDRMEQPGVRDYLYRVEALLRDILNESNFYSMAPHLLDELILFGTAAMSHVDDFQDVARFYTHTIGSYMVSTDERGVVDTLFREFEWPASRIVQKFGYKNASYSVRNAIDQGRLGSWYPVCHIIEPNDEFRPRSPFAKNKKFKSVYYEPGNQGADQDLWLSKGGFDEFPVYVPRWDLTDEDHYGTDCPGMTALGDIKGLQMEEKRKAQGIDKMINPPMSGPPSIRNVPVSGLPGGLTIYDQGAERQALAPLYMVQPNLQDLRLDMQAVEQRIDRAFFVDLFLAITNMEGIQPRNQLDLMHRNEERLLQIGPVLQRIQGELLSLLINRTFNQAARAGILPPAPTVLQNQELRIQYISTLAMAQRAVATQGIERLAGFAGNLASLGFPGALDKFDADQAVDEFARAIGAPPSLVVPDDVVAENRAAAAQQEQQMAMMEMAQQAANTAKMASDAKTSEPSVMTEVMNGL